MSKHVDVEMSSLDQVIARENQLHLMFVKTGVSLRAENDETEIINGFLALFIKPTASISWVPSSVLDSEDTFIYNQFAKRTKNSLILNKSPETKPLKSINRESITIQIENISHIVIQSDLTLDSNLDSVCVVKLVIFAKDLLGDSNVPRSQVSSLDDEEQAINALGGGRYPPFWFQKEKLQVQAFSSQHQKLPTLSEVVSELTFWLNSIALGLVKHDTLPVYFITPFQANPNSPILIPKQPAPQHGIMGLMDKMSSMGMSVVKGGFGEQAAGDLKNKLEDATFEVLNAFSHITQITKQTGSQLLEHPLTRPVLQYVPTHIRDFFMTSEVATKLIDEYEGAGHYLQMISAEVKKRAKPVVNKDKIFILDTSRDFEKLKMLLKNDTLRKPGNKSLTAMEWLSYLEPSTGKLLISGREMREKIFAGGVENDIRPIVWQFLLNVHPWDSNESSRAETSKIKTASYNSLVENWKTILKDAFTDDEEVKQGLGNDQGGDEREEGNVVDKLKERKYRIEKDVVRTDRNLPFFAHSRTPESNETGDFIVDDSAVQSALLNNGFIPLTRNLDMLRSVLLTYTVYSFELGYVQGMNDLLAPILIVMQNEPDSFSCFVNYMETQKHNFYRDQTGMRKQLSNLGLLIRFLDPFLYSHLDESDSINLFCCFRWILTNFKREFEFEDTNLLWESEWACPFTSHFHLFFALAILNTHRQNILTKCHAFDETLKYCNDLSGILDCKLMIYRAEVLFHVFKLKITETARTRLGIDLETGISTREESEPGAGEKLVLIKETTPTWADADADLGLTSMSESELYDLISLLEKV